VRRREVWILNRSDLRILGSFDSPGNHYIGVDSKETSTRTEVAAPTASGGLNGTF